MAATGRPQEPTVTDMTAAFPSSTSARWPCLFIENATSSVAKQAAGAFTGEAHAHFWPPSVTGRPAPSASRRPRSRNSSSALPVRCAPSTSTPRLFRTDRRTDLWDRPSVHTPRHDSRERWRLVKLANLIRTAAVALCLAALAPSGQAQAGTPDAQLLRMYQPVTRFDPEERFRPTSVQSFLADAD